MKGKKTGASGERGKRTEERERKPNIQISIDKNNS
jgi:hypothetical protein